jgi:SAM-dependent methyltransferase
MRLLARQSCRVCGSSPLTPVIDLGEQYLQGSFIKPGLELPTDSRFPTQLVRCDASTQPDACGLLQISHSVPAEILYSNYWYRSGTNQTMRDHLAGIVTQAITYTSAERGARVLDIGCNDGTLLRAYGDRYERYGVDPSNIAAEIEPPITVINTVFPSEQTKAAFATLKFDVVTTIAMFYDLEDPVGFAKEISSLLAPSGVWILEMSYMPTMLEQNAFDTICHEHIEYYSLAVLDRVMERAGLRIFRAELNSSNGGSIRCFVSQTSDALVSKPAHENAVKTLRRQEQCLMLDTNAPYLAFQHRADQFKTDLRTLVHDVRADGKTIHVYGASTKGNTILQWCGLDKEVIECAADRNPEKHGARTLGTDIPIVSERESREAKPDYYLVLPWHFKAEFLRREADTIRAGTAMIFPLPELAVIDASNLEAALRDTE